MTLNVRLASAILLVATLPLMLLSMVLHASHRDDITRATEEHLRSAASIQGARVAAALARDAERLALIGGRGDLQRTLARHLETRDPASRAQLNRILAEARGAVAEIEDIVVYDLGGLAVAATDSTAIGHVHPRRALFDRARRRPIVDHLQQDGRGRPQLALAGPVVREGAAMGVVVIHASAGSLHRALADTAGLGETGETVLARPLGEDRWRFLAPTRLRPDATFAEFTSTCTALPGSRALGDGGPQGVCVDYRGQPVFAVSQAVPGTDWSLVVKIDRAEALAPLNRSMVWLFALAAGLCAVIVAATLHFCRRLDPPLAELAATAGGVGEHDDGDQRGQRGRRGERGDADRGRLTPGRTPEAADALAARLDTMGIQVAAAHAALERNARRLQDEIARRREVEAECESLGAELARVRDQIRAGRCPDCGARHRQQAEKARRGEIRD